MGIPAAIGVSAIGTPPAGDVASLVYSGSFSAVGPGIPFQVVGPFNMALWASVNTTLTTTASSASASVGSGTGIAIGTAINSVNVPPGTTWKTFSGTSGTLAFPTVSLIGTPLTSVPQITLLPTAYSLSTLVGSTVSGPGIPSGTTVTSVSGQTALLSATPTSNSAKALYFALGTACVTGGSDTAATFTGASTTFSATVQIERSFDGGKTWVVANIGGGGALAQFSAGTPVSLAFGEPERGVVYRFNCIAYTSGTINYRISTTGAAAMALAINQLT